MTNFARARRSCAPATFLTASRARSSGSVNVTIAAVEIFNFGEILTKAGFSCPLHASEPDDGSLLPRVAEQVQPETPVYHMQLYFQNSSAKRKCIYWQLGTGLAPCRVQSRPLYH